MKRNLIYIVANLSLLAVMAIISAGCAGSAEEESSEQMEQTPMDGEWISMWDGESFDGWRASENPDSFTIEDGVIVAFGPRAHLFYEGPIGNADFTNFEFRVDVRTFPGANAGIFFHTEYQEEGWPTVGYEAQVNATHTDDIKTGSVYSVDNIMNQAPHEDNEWFTYGIAVDGNTVTLSVNGEVVNQYTEPAGREGTVKLGSGTIAFQAHDPESRVEFRNPEIRLLD